MGVETLRLPLKQVRDVGNCVQSSSRAQYKRVFRQQVWIDNAAILLGLLEMGIRKEKKQLA